MRSSDLAALCGVTVRTLRHYHAIGLLPEPPRSRNGYRRYTAEHVTRLLRIRLLMDAGVPLSSIAPVIDGSGSSSSTAALRRTEEELTTRIDHLEAQRETIRGLLANASDDELVLTPPALEPALRSQNDHVPRAWVAFDEHLALVLHLTTRRKDARRSIAAVYRRAEEAAATPRLQQLRQQFADLTSSTDSDEIDAIVSDSTITIAELGDARPLTLSRTQLRAVDLLIGISPFNAPQRLVLRRLLRVPAAVQRSAP